jgi:hypothetical protein
VDLSVGQQPTWEKAAIRARPLSAARAKVRRREAAADEPQPEVSPLVDRVLDSIPPSSAAAQVVVATNLWYDDTVRRKPSIVSSSCHNAGTMRTAASSSTNL